MTTKPRTTLRRKSIASTEAGGRTLPARLYELRKALGFSQEALGAQGIVSTPGWIKIENGQRSASEKLLEAFVGLLAEEKVIRPNQKATLLNELCALKYAGNRSPFLSGMAKDYLEVTPTVEINAAAK